MPFELPDLPYAYDALEPHIDGQTMKIHHTKHHAGYVKKANAALEGTKWADMTPEEVLVQIEQIPDDKRTAVRNNLGGHANHSLFWTILAPANQGGGGEPSGDLSEAIKGEWGDFSDFKDAFAGAATGQFGSGWAWLGFNESGKLHIHSTPNQDSPLMMGHKPIMGLDVWEHAYYLNYQNKRPEYIEAFWNVVNWDQVAKNYKAAKKG